MGVVIRNLSHTHVPNLKMDHEHCRRCVNSRCTESPSCPVEHCQNDCGVSLHRCKWEEHNKYTCPEAIVCCTNSPYGCKEKIPRKKLGTHIQHCPASVILCVFVHERPLLGDAAVEYLSDLKDISPVDVKFLDGDTRLFQEEHKGPSPPPLLDISTGSSSYSQTSRSTTSVLCNDYRYFQRGKFTTNQMFPCNEFIRRDEFAFHWKNLHLDIELGIESIIQRCPLKRYGCTHSRKNMVPSISGSSLDYNHKDGFILKSAVESDHNKDQIPSEFEAKIQVKKELALYGYGDDEEESYDVLGQLPFEVLQKIVGYLDSLALWNLSLVNYYLRKVCFSLVRKQGIVYWKWKKEASGWKVSPDSEVWSFSKVFSKVQSWSHTTTPPIAAHMLSCDTFKSIPITQDTQETRVMAMVGATPLGKKLEL